LYFIITAALCVLINGWLDKLKIHKASGPDQVPVRLLKTVADEIAPALSLLFSSFVPHLIGIMHWLLAYSKKVTVRKPLITDLSP